MSKLNLRLVRNKTYPEMWHVRYDDGTMSDMLNYSRAVDLLKELERGVAPWIPVVELPAKKSGKKKLSDLRTT